MALRRHSGRWAYTKRLNTELGRKIARCDCTDYAEENHADVIVFEYLEMQGKISGKEKTETAPVEKAGYPEDAVNIRHTGKRCVISRICAWNTSRLAYDGSGAVTA